eukprot:SAG22_NODE_5982_length_921_cov_2.004866_1_plen_79_part_00
MPPAGCPVLPGLTAAHLLPPDQLPPIWPMAAEVGGGGGGGGGGGSNGTLRLHPAQFEIVRAFAQHPANKVGMAVNAIR